MRGFVRVRFQAKDCQSAFLKFLRTSSPTARDKEASCRNTNRGVGCSRPTGGMLNEISNTAWYNQSAIRYNSLPTKHQQREKYENTTSHKIYNAVFEYNAAQ